MLRADRMILLSSGLLAALAGGSEASARDVSSCAAGAFATFATMTVGSKLATAQQPAQVLPEAGPSSLASSPALRITLRPMAADPDSPFIAQVFAAKTCGAKEGGPGELLGTVSFYPLKVGQSQDFVLPAPPHGFPSVAPGDVQVTVKLISANPARSLENASVEVVDAQFAK